MKRTKRDRRVARVSRFIVLSSFLIFGVYVLIFSKSWVNIYKKYQEKKVLTTELEELKKEEEVLRANVDKLKDPDYIARYAREKYLYTKDGEYVIKLP